MNWGNNHMQIKEVDFPAKNLDDLMSKAYQKGAIGVQHHPDNLSGSAYWKIIYRLNGIAAPRECSWPLYIRSDLVPQRWLPGGNATGESIQLSVSFSIYLCNLTFLLLFDPIVIPNNFY